MIVVTAYAEVRPEGRDRAREAMLTAQAASVQEDGCESYRFYQALDHDCSFVVVDNWRDLAAWQAHMQTPHIAELIDVLHEILVGGLDIRAYEATQVDPG